MIQEYENMKMNKLLAAVAVLALVVAAAAVIMTPADAAGDVTVTDVQYQEEKERLKVTLSGNYSSTPATVTISGDSLEAPIEALGYFFNTSAGFIYITGNTLDEGTYTIKIDNLAAYDFVVSDEPVIKSIAATAAKTSYFVGESFDATGLTVTATYDDGTTATLAANDYTYAPTGALALTDTKITVTLVADQKITTDVTISVKEKLIPVNVNFEISSGFAKTVVAIVGQPVEPIADPKVEGAVFLGWFLADATEPFNFNTPIAAETTLYAHFGPEAPSTEQTSKLVASLVYEEKDGVTLVATAYDDNVIGKGTATVTVLQEVDFLGLKAYIEVGTFTIDFDTSDCYAYQNISEEASEYITESGNYAMSADIVLDNKTTASSNYIVFDIEINEQA